MKAPELAIPFPKARSLHVARTKAQATPSDDFLSMSGDVSSLPPTTLKTWCDDKKLHLEVSCRGKKSLTLHDEVCVYIATKEKTSRCWQINIDAKGQVSQYESGSNLTRDILHRPLNSRASHGDSRLSVQLDIPFTSLGKSPKAGDKWFFNVMRYNRKTGDISLWTPTYVEVLSIEYFGHLVFPSKAKTQPMSLNGKPYHEFAEEQLHEILKVVQHMDENEVLESLSFPGRSMADWVCYLKGIKTQRTHRFQSGWKKFKEIQAIDRPYVKGLAKQYLQDHAKGKVKEVEALYYNFMELEKLADLLEIKNDPRIVNLFEAKVLGLERGIQAIEFKSTKDVLTQIHDQFAFEVGMFGAYSYFKCLPHLPDDSPVHLSVMRLILLISRVAAWRTRASYNYGNHQIFETCGLICTVLAFPEFRDAKRWLKLAEKRLVMHIRKDFYADGCFKERCPYHFVALQFITHTLESIIGNRRKADFSLLCSDKVMSIIEKAHLWNANILTPLGDFPTGGDSGSYDMYRVVRSTNEVFKHRGVSSLLKDLHKPSKNTKSHPGLELNFSTKTSGYSVLRNAWGKNAQYIHLDHGENGGQHSHGDNMSFNLYANGEAISINTGMNYYADPLYNGWYRKLNSHNSVSIDNQESVKMSRRLAYANGKHSALVSMQSLGYWNLMQTLHARHALFLHDWGWIFFDQLIGQGETHEYEWHFHTHASLKRKGKGYVGKYPGSKAAFHITNLDAGDWTRHDDMPRPVPCPDKHRGTRIGDFGFLHGDKKVAMSRHVGIVQQSRAKLTDYVVAILTQAPGQDRPQVERDDHVITLSRGTERLSIEIDKKEPLKTLSAQSSATRIRALLNLTRRGKVIWSEKLG